MLELVVKLVVLLLALAWCAQGDWLADGRLPFGLAGAAIFHAGQRKITLAVVRYRPRRAYWRLAIA